MSLSDEQSVDRFQVFTDTCRAAGVDSSSGRLEVFLALSESVQDSAFADLVRRIKGASGADNRPPSSVAPLT
jgi:hypothetical protein